MTSVALLSRLSEAHEQLARMVRPLIPSRPDVDPDVQLAALLREVMRHVELWVWVERQQRGAYQLLVGVYNDEQIRKGMGREDGSTAQEKCG